MRFPVLEKNRSIEIEESSKNRMLQIGTLSRETESTNGEKCELQDRNFKKKKQQSFGIFHLSKKLRMEQNESPSECKFQLREKLSKETLIFEGRIPICSTGEP